MFLIGIGMTQHTSPTPNPDHSTNTPTRQATFLSRTYPAPRQGRFALVLLVSLFVHILGFVLTLEHTFIAQKQKAIEELALHLAAEVKKPLVADDRIGLSVIAENYKAKAGVGFVGIFDAKDKLLVPTGTDTGVAGKSVVVSEGTLPIGRVEIKPDPINRAEVMKTHWLYLLGSVGMHFLLWAGYAALARPPRQLKKEIAEEVRSDMIATKAQADTPVPPPSTPAPPNSVQAFIQSQLTGTPSPTKPTIELDDEKAIVVKIIFTDKRELFGVMAQGQAHAYLALCNQLLEKTLVCLAKNALAARVSYQIQEPFDEHGAVVVLTSEDANARTPLVAAMFVKLFVSVNQIVYKKHRELKKFALPIKAIAADGSRLGIATQIVSTEQEATFVMMEKTKITQIAQHINLVPYKAPTSIHEKDTFVLTQVNDNISRILENLRKDILSVD